MKHLVASIGFAGVLVFAASLNNPANHHNEPVKHGPAPIIAPIIEQNYGLLFPEWVSSDSWTERTMANELYWVKVENHYYLRRIDSEGNFEPMLKEDHWEPTIDHLKGKFRSISWLVNKAVVDEFHRQLIGADKSESKYE